MLFDFVSKKLLNIHFPDNFTLYPYNDTAPSTVDIGISKNYSFNIITNALEELDSDHLPVLIILDKFSNIATEEQTFLNYKKADWKKFQKSVNLSLKIKNNLRTNVEIDDAVDEFVGIIQNAISTSVPKIKTKHKITFISDEIKLLI